VIGAVVLLVFITAFRVVFYWGEKTTKAHLTPAAAVVPQESMPPIWWRN